MVTFVLDASAAIRFLDAEAGGERVREVLRLSGESRCRVIISAVNWGEIIGKLATRSDKKTANAYAAAFAALGLEVIDASAARAAKSALIKIDYKIPYADAFGVELTSDSPEHILVTADFDVKPAEHLIRIEFLPTKPKL